MFSVEELPALILFFMLIEGALLSAQPKDRRQRIGSSLVAGAGLTLAWLFSRTTVPFWLVLVPLAGALAAHVVDLRQRWRS
jgi:hypothetical protein